MKLQKSVTLIGKWFLTEDLWWTDKKYVISRTRIKIKRALIILQPTSLILQHACYTKIYNLRISSHIMLNTGKVVSNFKMDYSHSKFEFKLHYLHVSNSCFRIQIWTDLKIKINSTKRIEAALFYNIVYVQMHKVGCIYAIEDCLGLEYLEQKFWWKGLYKIQYDVTRWQQDFIWGDKTENAELMRVILGSDEKAWSSSRWSSSCFMIMQWYWWWEKSECTKPFLPCLDFFCF